MPLKPSNFSRRRTVIRLPKRASGYKDAPIREDVLGAARELFTAQGYTATTVEEIAGRAGVSKPTVFAAAGSKQAILKQLRDIALGDDEPVPVAQRPWYREALAEPDPHRALHLYARNATAIHDRSADVHEVLKAAAASDKDLHDLWRASEDERRGGAAIVVNALLHKSRLKAGLDRAAAIDIVWILTASDIFWRLVRTRQWSLPRYQSWLGDTLCEQLLPPAERHSRS
jgi:TetR/AcrR family transcriptional regulator, regulator of autoinduction and epiphytic fitness